MGMAASQARLLSITARLHDVELKAQHIMNEKVVLATQEDAAYTKYCDALDATKVQVAFSDGTSTKYLDATFSNVCTYSDTRKCQYALTDADTGKMIVQQDVYDNYKEYDADKYSFAWAMLGFSESDAHSDFCWDNDSYGNNVGTNSGAVNGDVCDGGSGCMLAMSEVEQIVFENHKDDSQYGTLVSAYDDYQEALNSGDYSKQYEALRYFRDQLYSKSSLKDEIYNLMRLDKSGKTREQSLASQDYLNGFPDEFAGTMSSQFNYYVALFEGIKQAGGCITITEFSKDAKVSDNDWFNDVVRSGSAILNIYNTSDKEWTETSIATTTSENYLQEGQDEANIKKAEVEYEHALSKIKNKDSQYDHDLQELETERTALTTEMDSIKQVKNDNIERTFGIFS